TGGASGIGAAAVRRLHAEGAAVVAGDVDETGLTRLAGELGERVAGVRCDVTEERDVERLVAAAVERFGRVDLGFNVAGGGRGGAIVELDAADWRHTVDLSLTGAFHGVKHQARQMIAQASGGAIVNVSSICAQLPNYGGAGYCSAKAGLEMLTHVAALELGAHGIRVNAIAPGRTATAATAEADAQPAMRDAWIEQTPLARIGEADEMASVMLFLAGDDAAFVSGASVVVDGAFSTTHFESVFRPFRAQP
ncbi:MAG TPA: SDR family oxidoreductase, partial [Conexibacter sp.]|nr:SDR family oxidoreductase [Conexibacter sp.]